MKRKKYKIYFQAKKFVPIKKRVKGWRNAKRRLDWFKARGIKAYAKKSTGKKRVIRGV